MNEKILRERGEGLISKKQCITITPNSNTHTSVEGYNKGVMYETINERFGVRNRKNFFSIKHNNVNLYTLQLLSQFLLIGLERT